MKGADFMRGGEQLVPLSVSPLQQKRARVRVRCPRKSALRRQPMGCVCVAGNNLIERRARVHLCIPPYVHLFFLHSPSFFFIFSASEVERRHSIARTHEPPPLPLSPRRPRGRQT